ncbi:MAG: hypothetical protein LC118_07305 [Dehalococcoidia bacterium]|nr:hypothetical protein [Dehalococcoidia bacterium]
MNRKDRRADPPRWYKLDAYFDKRTEHVHGLDDKHAQYVLGRIDDIVIVQVPDDMAPAQRIAFMQGFREVAALASQEMKYILVPSSVKMLRLRPVDPAASKELDRQMRLRQVEANVRAEKASKPGDNKPKPS